MHYYIASIEEQNGEQSYDFPVLFQCTLPAQAEKTANQIARGWYDSSEDADIDEADDDEEVQTRNVFEFEPGLTARWRGLREIPEDHFKFLTEHNYLSDHTLESEKVI